MKKFHYHPILLAAILVGFIASLLIGMERHAVEEDSRTVELAIDYEGLLELAAREGLPAEEVLAEAKAAGITSLAVYETTFKKFNENGKANAVKGADILAAYHTGTLTDPRWRTLVEDGKIVGTEIYVVSHDPVTYAELKEDLLRRFGAARITVLTVGTDEVIAVKDLYEVFLKRNIGLPSDEMRAVNAAGFDVIARPSNYYDCTPDDVHAVFARMDGIAVSAGDARCAEGAADHDRRDARASALARSDRGRDSAAVLQAAGHGRDREGRRLRPCRASLQHPSG